MLKIGRYTVSPHTFRAMKRMVRDAVRVTLRGIPKVPHRDHADLATAVLRANAGAVFRAGAGHFHVMWPADMGKAFGGAMKAVPHEYLLAHVRRMASVGARVGHVPTCFTPDGWYDLPWKRADNVPWLLHMADSLRAAGNEIPEATRKDLDRVYADWARDHVDAATGLVRREVWGDWMDTVPRPSSTYNNLCALRAYAAAAALGLTSSPTYESEATRALLDGRWTGTHLRDHADETTGYLSTDANVPALYLGVLPEANRRRIADALEASTLFAPAPMRTREGAFTKRELGFLARWAPTYHSTTWLHLGLMHANGLKKLERGYDHHLTAVDRVVGKHHNFLETLDGRGEPYRAPLITTEYGFSMSAGQYLELVA